MSAGTRLIDAIAWLVAAYRRTHWVIASAFLLLALWLLGAALVRGSGRTALLGTACLAWAVACADPRLLPSPREPHRQAARTTRITFGLAMVLGGMHALVLFGAI